MAVCILLMGLSSALALFAVASALQSACVLQLPASGSSVPVTWGCFGFVVTLEAGILVSWLSSADRDR